MRYFSTFSGIGGFELGIQLAYEALCNVDGSEVGGSKENKAGDKGQRFQSTERQGTSSKKRLTSERDNNIFDQRPLCVGYSEIDKYATQIYQKHFPNHINYGDITKIDAANLPDFELLVGGFPCQSFSIAGKRRGFDDTRGTMFFELARIIKEKQPRLLVLENVKGLLSHDQGNTFYTIITTLDELGYDCEWQVLNSKNHGVPQNRERVFIIGHLRGTPRPEVFPFGHSNPKTPQQLLGGSQGNRVYSPKGTSVTLASQAGGQGAKTGLYAMRGRENGQQLEYRGDETNTLTSVQKDNLWYEGTTIRRLTPTECERLQGFPYCWTEGVSDTQRYKTLGNAVTVNVIRDIFKKIL